MVEMVDTRNPVIKTTIFTGSDLKFHFNGIDLPMLMTCFNMEFKSLKKHLSKVVSIDHNNPSQPTFHPHDSRVGSGLLAL